MNKNFIYHFGQHRQDGDISMKDILGSKGAHLAEMSKLNLAVPPGFTISTDLCKYYYQNGYTFPANFIDQLKEALKYLENITGKFLSDTKNPLLVSVRSGAAVSMPGMMDTILNIGLNKTIVQSLAQNSKNEYFIYDSYRRLIEIYGVTVLQIDQCIFAEIHDSYKEHNNKTLLSLQDLRSMITKFEQVVKKYTKKELESDPFKQICGAIECVLQSWMSPRAIEYRKIYNISDDHGTAVNIQTMVFGNKNDQSGTGVVFSRCPSYGYNILWGEFMPNAQGEDIVSGSHTPYPIYSSQNKKKEISLFSLMPEQYLELKKIAQLLESHYKDIQDIEFTIEDNKLYILQTRSAKRTSAANIKFITDAANTGLITKKDAISRIDLKSINMILHKSIDYNSLTTTIIGKGLASSPGAATGIAVFSSEEASSLSVKNNVILIRRETSPEDIKGLSCATGIITMTGGMTSHAAVVARGLGKPCICSVENIIIHENEKYCTINNILIKKGDFITIDGSLGNIMLGREKLSNTKFSSELKQILSWSDQYNSMSVRANAETELDTITALNFGAKGIGLCRTEHMFFDANKLLLMRSMILTQNKDLYFQSLIELEKIQRLDLKKIIKLCDQNPINIRLLDPPLHEFLPTEKNDYSALAKHLQINIDDLLQRVYQLKETNPMLGHRGCRLGITHPEIYDMQIDAILNALTELYNDTNIIYQVEIMIPLVSDDKELSIILNRIRKIINLHEKKHNISFNIKLGTMIELPRAAIIAAKLALEIDFISFGTNDLTQTVYGVSRDDIASFLTHYIDNQIWLHDPFVTIDKYGVGKMIEIAMSQAKKVNPKIKFGVCGEHAGDPESIDFFYKLGINYISCSPYRVPLAKIACAQSKLNVTKFKD